MFEENEKPNCNYALQKSIHYRNNQLRNFQFVSQKLIEVFAVRLKNIFFQNQAMNDCQSGINAIN